MQKVSYHSNWGRIFHLQLRIFRLVLALSDSLAALTAPLARGSSKLSLLEKAKPDAIIASLLSSRFDMLKAWY